MALLNIFHILMNNIEFFKTIFILEPVTVQDSYNILNLYPKQMKK